MGTSRSHPGPNGRTPLVPSWANEAAGGEGPVPAPTERRFTGFRSGLGKFVASGDRAALGAALRSYARSGSGGARHATARVAPATKTLSALFGAIGRAQGVPGADGDGALDLRSLAGRPANEAIEAILDTLCPPGGVADSDEIRTAMNEALAEMLAGEAIFDPDLLTPDDGLVLVERFLCETLFSRMVLEGGKAFDRTSDPVAQVRAETEFRNVIRASVGAHLPAVLPVQGSFFTRAAIDSAVGALIERVWADWQGGGS